MSSNEHSTFKIAFNLAAACFISGIVIGSVYFVTAPVAAQKAEEMKQESMKALVPEAEHFQEVAGHDGWFAAEKGGKATVRYSGRWGWEEPTVSTDFETRGYWSVYTVDKFWMADAGKKYTTYTDHDMAELLARVNDKVEDPSRPWVVEEVRNGREQWAIMPTRTGIMSSTTTAIPSSSTTSPSPAATRK